MAVGANATTLSTFESGGVLPKSMATKIITKAYGESIVGRLAGSIPMPITGTSLAFGTGSPVAGIVGEGELKPAINAKVATKTTTPIKAAALMYWSKEARQANPVAYLSYLESTAKDAIRRAIDMAVIHGKNAVTDATIAGVEYLTQTTKKVTLGTTAAASGGLTGDILAGYELLVNDEGDITGFAADPRMRVSLMKATYTDGKPIFTAGGRGGADLGDSMGDLLGLPVTYGRAVGGGLGVVADTKTRLIGGKFTDNLQFGYVENITLRRTDVGTVEDGSTSVNLFQQNMEALIVEAQFGWIIKDVNDFVVYSEGA